MLEPDDSQPAPTEEEIRRRRWQIAWDEYVQSLKAVSLQFDELRDQMRAVKHRYCAGSVLETHFEMQIMSAAAALDAVQVALLRQDVALRDWQEERRR